MFLKRVQTATMSDFAKVCFFFLKNPFYEIRYELILEKKMMIYVKEAESQDFLIVLSLIKNELGYPNLNETDTLKRLEYFKQSKDWETSVAVVDSETVGFIGVRKGMSYAIDGFYVEIAALAVAEEARRGGVGAALVKKAEEWALKNGTDEMRLHSNMKRLDAHLFYEKIGYGKKSYWFSKKLGGAK